MLNSHDFARDAAIVLEYATEKYIQQPDSFGNMLGNGKVKVKILVHGESLGGMSASSLAMKGQKVPVDFVFIDRTFASLNTVAMWMPGIQALTPSLLNQSSSSRSCCFMKRGRFSQGCGKFIQTVFKLVTQWKDNNHKNYTNIEKCKANYVLFGCDPVNDNIVPDIANLKTANTKAFVQESL